MNIGSSTALLPVERTASLALTKGGHERAGHPANPSGSRGKLVFLGYGPKAAEGLYDDAGKHVRAGHPPGAVVDLYV